MIDLRRLRALHQQGTAGDWGVNPVDSDFLVAADGTTIAQTFSKQERDYPNGKNNVRLIAAMRNALPELLQAAESLETLRGMRDLIEDALSVYCESVECIRCVVLRDLLAVIAAEPAR